MVLTAGELGVVAADQLEQALEGVEEGSKGQSDRLGVVVGVREGINAYIPEDGKVVD